MRYRALVSRLATFGALIGCRARACVSLTSAYSPERDGHRPSVFLKVAVCDTGCGVCLVVCGVGVGVGVGVSVLGLLLRRR